MENMSIQPFWKGFWLENNNRRWFYTDGTSVVELDSAEWFNKTTNNVTIYKGYETSENNTKPVSEAMYYIEVDYQIANYFGDRSGAHCRNRSYVLIGDKLYKQENSAGVEVKRLTREIKGILKEIQTLHW